MKFGELHLLNEFPVETFVEDGWALYEVLRSGDVMQSNSPDSKVVRVYKLFEHTIAGKERFPHQEGQILSSFFSEPRFYYIGSKETADKFYKKSSEAFQKHQQDLANKGN